MIVAVLDANVLYPPALRDLKEISVKTSWFALLVGGLVLGSPATVLAQQGLLHPGPADQAARVAQLRSAGLRGDRAQVPALIAELKKPSSPRAVYIVARALAQIGAVEALPVLEAAIQNGEDGDMRAFTRMARARLLAEASAQEIADPAKRAEARLNRFLSELTLDVGQLNAAKESLDQVGRITATHGARPVNSYALREVADMIYHGRDLALAAHAKSLGINFEQDYPAALKVRLAPLSDAERVSWLIDDFSKARVLNDERYYEIQLAANAGLPASRAAAVKLREIQRDRAKYEYGAISGLMQVIRCVGDQSGASVIADFLGDQDTYVAHDARILLEPTRQGLPVQCRVTY